MSSKEVRTADSARFWTFKQQFWNGERGRMLSNQNQKDRYSLWQECDFWEQHKRREIYQGFKKSWNFFVEQAN